MLAKIRALREQSRQARQDVEIFQEALVFSPSSGNRESRPEAQLHPQPSGVLNSNSHVLSEQEYYLSLRRPEKDWRDRELPEEICEYLREAAKKRQQLRCLANHRLA